MTWTAFFILAAGTFALRAVGVFLGRSATTRESSLATVTALLPAALLAALVALQTFTAGAGLVLDARAVGLGAAALAIVLRAPFAVVVAVAAAVAALWRLLA